MDGDWSRGLGLAVVLDAVALSSAVLAHLRTLLAEPVDGQRRVERPRA